MKTIFKLLLAFTFLIPFVSCENEDVLEQSSIHQESQENQPISARSATWLKDQEKYGGHTLMKHYNRSNVQLDARGIAIASTFTTNDPKLSTLRSQNDLGIMLKNIQTANNRRLSRMRKGDATIAIDSKNNKGAVGILRENGKNRVTAKFRTVWKYHHLYGSFLLTAYPIP
ncbi:hypothetical protein PG911_18190 [Tenacibaculum ovolyticum]|uniref:hypothetical protein n=1 Tax=Tenacibaculum ovolyticum TaxID=104270 RepID=UPI0022F3DE17|nr:hypothetical protein [Tenacibaculum ovolyticum]WBX76521.1 hypothetical protein PG911_18190 [Tenacibaculum ovolyticum]